jgi:membrane-bound ClpP family serine protease
MEWIGVAFKVSFTRGDIWLTLLFIASLLDEAIIVVVVLLLLPRFGIQITQPWLTIFLVGLGVYAVVTQRLVIRALKRKPVAGMTSMAGTTGRVKAALKPIGMIKVNGELWKAWSPEGNIGVGQEVTVISQEGLLLTVQRTVRTNRRMKSNVPKRRITT